MTSAPRALLRGWAQPPQDLLDAQALLTRQFESRLDRQQTAPPVAVIQILHRRLARGPLKVIQFSLHEMRRLDAPLLPSAFRFHLRVTPYVRPPDESSMNHLATIRRRGYQCQFKN
jgi:hypothetical protein